MAVLRVQQIGVCVALILGMLQAASARELLIGDDKSRPESLTVALGGVLIVGSASSPLVYTVRPGSSLAEKFIDVSAEGPGTSFLGALADAVNHTLRTCQRTSIPNSSPMQGRSALRGFDLSTGAPKFRWNLPGENTACNDFAFGPDHALYIRDTFTGRVYRLAAGASSAELYAENEALRGVDGITFLNGTLYVNNVFSGKLYRIPAGADGRAQVPIEVSTDQPLKGPDGMRAANGKRVDISSKVRTPEVLVPPHMASLEMVFTPTHAGSAAGDHFFPKEYAGGILAAEHGSWNRANRAGYEVIFIPLHDGQSSGAYDDFLTGFVTKDGGVWGRPVGVAVGKDGSLFVVDDGSRTIWRVAWAGESSPKY